MYFHIWFVTKYRKAILKGTIERKAKDTFLEVSRNKQYKILEMGINGDHVHMLLEAANKVELANMVRVLKAVSAKKILEETIPHLRAKNGYHTRKSVEAKRHFWAKRYGYKVVAQKHIPRVTQYIREQNKCPSHTSLFQSQRTN